MKLGTFIAAAAMSAAVASSAFAGDAESCKKVRLSDVGWTDITLTTAMTGIILNDLGYEGNIKVLEVPVTFASMKNKDLDVFLGNWMPSMEGDIRKYLDDKSVEQLEANLSDAKYTLAVPTYLYDKGLKDFADIQKFSKDLKGTLYGIEPGNDGNRHILEMIKTNDFGLGKFKLKESSEQGMLTAVGKAYKKKQGIVFLGWAPHPMNQFYDMSYLTGGDKYFGPNFGAATVYTTVRQGYAAECPNVAALLKNLKFDSKIETAWMVDVANGKKPEDVVTAWMKANPDQVAKMLAGVTTFDGQPGEPAVKKALGM